MKNNYVNKLSDQERQKRIAYKLNDMNEPTLFVPNLGRNKLEGVAQSIRVEFQQTATHIHHAPEFGITLPDNFDMTYYQNEIAKHLTPIFNPNTSSQEGIAGQQKVPLVSCK